MNRDIGYRTQDIGLDIGHGKWDKGKLTMKSAIISPEI